MEVPRQACSDYMVDLQSPLRLCRCGFPKSEHVDSPTRKRVLKQNRSLGSIPVAGANAGSQEIQSTKACGQFVIDLNSTQFGVCRCGYPKSAHVGAETTSTTRQSQDASIVRDRKERLNSGADALICRPAVSAAATRTRASTALPGHVASALGHFEELTKQKHELRQKDERRPSIVGNSPKSADVTGEAPAFEDIADAVTDGSETSCHGDRQLSIDQSPGSSQESLIDAAQVAEKTYDDEESVLAAEDTCQTSSDVMKEAEERAAAEKATAEAEAAEAEKRAAAEKAAAEAEAAEAEERAAAEKAAAEAEAARAEEEAAAQAAREAEAAEIVRQREEKEEAAAKAAAEQKALEEQRRVREEEARKQEEMAAANKAAEQKALEEERRRAQEEEERRQQAENEAATWTEEAREAEERALAERIEAEQEAAAQHAREVEVATRARQRDEEKSAAKMAAEQKALEEQRQKAQDEKAQKLVAERALKIEQEEQKRLQRARAREEEALRMASQKEQAAREAAAKKAAKRTSSIQCGCGNKLKVTPDEMQTLAKYIPDYAEKSADELAQELPRLRMGAWMQGSKHLFAKAAPPPVARARTNSVPCGERRVELPWEREGTRDDAKGKGKGKSSRKGKDKGEDVWRSRGQTMW